MQVIPIVEVGESVVNPEVVYSVLDFVVLYAVTSMALTGATTLAGLDLESAIGAVVATETRADDLLRLPGDDWHLIGTALDWGAWNLMIPVVESAQQAEAIVRELERQAGQSAAAERWSAASELYRQIQRLAPEAATANQGLQRAEARTDLHRRLDAFLDQLLGSLFFFGFEPCTSRDKHKHTQTGKQQPFPIHRHPT